MADISIRGLSKVYPNGVVAVRDVRPRSRRRRVPGPRRPVRLRQVDAAADDRRTRGGHCRRAVDRRTRHHRRAASRTRHRDGVPELRAVPAHDGAQEHRLSAEAGGRAVGRDECARARGGQDARARDRARPQAGSAVGWPAAAGGDGARHRAQAVGVLDGRAAVEPGREAARADARRDRPHPTRVPDDHDLRDPRSGRGDDHGRSRRRPERRPDRAMRSSPRSVRPSGQLVRGRVHRLTFDELLLGDGRATRRRPGRRRRVDRRATRFGGLRRPG